MMNRSAPPAHSIAIGTASSWVKAPASSWWKSSSMRGAAVRKSIANSPVMEFRPTINLENPDEQCDLNYTPNVAQERTVRVALNNSFGFGGHNATLVTTAFDS